MRNKLNKILEEYEAKTLLKFQPTKEFYRKVKIGQQRLGIIRRNEKQPDLNELEALAKYFNVSIYDLIEDTTSGMQTAIAATN